MKFGMMVFSFFMQVSLWSGLIPIVAQVDQPEIVSPAPGAALQGTVTVMGTSDINDFSSYEVSFAYDEGEEPSWFELNSSRKMIRNGELATWDTTTIADGTYMLRLRVHLENGNLKDVIVQDLRVRNYSPVETSTPQPVVTNESTTAPIETNAAPQPTPITTKMSSNPASITPELVTRFLLGGALLAVAGFTFIGIYFAVRYSQKRG